MALESGMYLSDLVPANPPGTDPRSQGDNHFRLLKSILQNTIPSQGAPLHKVVDVGAAAITIDPLKDNNKVFALIGNTVTQPLPAGAGVPDGFTIWFVCYGFTFTVMAVGADTIAVHGEEVTDETVVTYDDGVLLYNGDWCRLTWTAGHWYAFQHCRPRVTSVNGMQGDVTIEADDITAILGSPPVTEESLGGEGVIVEDFTGTNQSLAASGYQKFPGGLIMQWGKVAVGPQSSGGGATFAFPIPFPHAVFMVSATPDGGGQGGGEDDYWGVNSITNTSVNILNLYNAPQTANIFAVGW